MVEVVSRRHEPSRRPLLGRRQSVIWTGWYLGAVAEEIVPVACMTWQISLKEITSVSFH